ncbi:MAG: tetratricopeptide repeat protein, partial [Verrucomicrobia subdivision 3 bacterium]|nr:tetratricopeptide repeat protein [Limisphaerales bacterium]
MDQPGNTRNLLLMGLLLAVVTLATYWPVGHHDFLNYDDPDYVTENEWVKGGLRWAGVNWAFTTGHAGNWHPVTWLSHALDVTVFDLQAGKHHLVNLGFHVANAILLLLLLNTMTGALWRSAFVAALFALHPLHVESVAWVAERKDVLSTFFGLLTLIAYSHFAQCDIQNSQFKIEERELGRGGQGKGQKAKSKNRGQAWYFVALVFYALGLMSKAMLVTWPFVMLLLDVWPLRRVTTDAWRGTGSTWQRLALEKVPFFALAIASSLVTSLVQAQGGAVSTAGNLPVGDRLANAVASYLKYLGKTFWPTDLAIFYPHPDLRYPVSEQWPLALTVAAGLLLIVISGLAVRRRKDQPYLATGWFWYLGTLVPVIGIIQVGTQAMADRYSYVPLIGIFICVVWAATDFLTHLRLGKTGLALIGTAAVAVSAVVAHFQVRTWQNDFTVFEHALAATRNNHVAHSILGKALVRQAKPERALEHFRAALAAYPNHADAHQDMGLTLYAMGKYPEAIEQFQAQLQARPNPLRSYNGLGAAYWALGEDD